MNDLRWLAEYVKDHVGGNWTPKELEAELSKLSHKFAPGALLTEFHSEIDLRVKTLVEHLRTEFTRERAAQTPDPEPLFENETPVDNLPVVDDQPSTVEPTNPE